jgi:tRNA-specific 2-thiouridylase
MLAALDPRRLSLVSFPLGEQDKEATRTEAERAGLAAARKPESQEACFLAGDDYRAFLGRHGLSPQEGAIVTEDGNELGRHDGFWRFTEGQRRGLGVVAPEPLYVLGTRPAANAVVVGPRASLARTHVTARGRLYVETERVEAKLRYRSPAVAARVEAIGRGFRLELGEPAYGVAAGQAAVLYDGDAVVGYGLITASH